MTDEKWGLQIGYSLDGIVKQSVSTYKTAARML